MQNEGHVTLDFNLHILLEFAFIHAYFIHFFIYSYSPQINALIDFKKDL